MQQYFLILFASILTSNIALTYFLGMCPFITISRNIGVAMGMGIAVTCVMTLTATANWLINEFLLIPMGLDFLQFLVFIVTIATIVQVLELVMDRYTPGLHHAFGIFLPLITVNCAILGISLIMVLRSFSFGQTVAYSFGSGIGWMLAIITMGALRKRLIFARPLRNFGAAGITAILAGLMALAFIGFSGMASL
ncbi:MAG: NADH:ubiquinone reductase (Na(+)-transporting) subunit E [Victivallales bacterium]|jgi:Na+-transporting NADH:ubiquinone oxidoreductase subunit E|nr:NADH:ubiquinone reductase (Na(+)-transporting) subunit E [Victivallales bacterium]MBT7164354.1 NADH:ubiquinone reductase (Na(+)-transporting) subunit E [Victivallales bacterium]MBT7302935.1 NADH:ubiquinone reductase (Na(+)-transporting) subunit E [Victivallales bacterium]